MSVLAVMVGAIIASLAAAGSSTVVVRAPRITGDREGVRLLLRVHDAYRAVPAVSILAVRNSTTFRDTFVLRAGSAVAELLEEHEMSGFTYQYVERGKPTLVRTPNEDCWRAVSASSPLALSDDMGARFPIPNARTVQVGQPVDSGPKWILRLRVVEYDGRTSSLRVVIERSSLRVLAFAYPGLGTAKVITRTAAKLPEPVQRCSA